MKTGTTDHPKMLDLADWIDQATGGALRDCGIDPESVAVGIMEKLWQWSAKYCPAGDVGRFSNARIASAVGWRGDADGLVDALVRIGWCDLDEEGRPILHHWSEHCEDAVHARLARKREYFADGTAPKLTKLEAGEKQEAKRHYEGIERLPAAGGARRRPAAADGALPGPGPGPKPMPKPLTREGRARAREAQPSPSPAAARPDKETTSLERKAEPDGGERDPEKPPEWCEAAEWREACRLASAIEAAETGETVVGRGLATRAVAVAMLLADAGKSQVVTLPASECASTIEVLAGGRWRDGPRLEKLLRAMQAYPDGVYPGLSGTAGHRRASRVEEAARLLGMGRASPLTGPRRVSGLLPGGRLESL
jgi:hypothetical protein